MRLKEVVLASILMAFLVSQNYLLMSLPITLTYAIIYLMKKAVKTKSVVYTAVIVFVIAKNIIFPSMPWTIFFDIIGLSLVLSGFYIKNNILRYIITVITILIHIFLLDFASAIMVGDILVVLGGIILSSFPVYIYAPLSGLLIILLDGVNYISELE